ncbi:type I polyketide synthase [Chryseobacterium sp. ON_d1]|uniref:type I polyketide synthase n=1 Tax=Chryseobacterium sp. ON_d1 TaxID=2583211 RepID=UPI0011578041|nr:type I polyketide synthase [Chryseobacterium sp. ON_d1]GEJ48149.1 polyketide synthase [Chryseobacterium sp. ON_d1]
MQRESLKRDIAIIGMSCMFSGCNNIQTFWDKLANGDELIQFYTDQELLESGVEAKVIRDSSYVKVKTFIENSDTFDYSFFGYTKDEAASMDPQIRILHHLVWEAFEDACYNPLKLQDKAGLYLTAPDNFNWIAHTNINKKATVDPFYLSQINNKNFSSSLISYNLNLKGPSIFIDTACSSSLVAIHMACRGLLLRECSMAVAGGIALNTKDEKGYRYEEGMISSKDGHCRAFDEKSSGTVGTEGGGVIVLKRLEDAIADNDNIYAVIRATAVNNDGKRKVGYTAPSVSGQVDCIRQAQSFAKVSAHEISYIEAHGTGTRLGDPIEIEALNTAFNYDKSFECAVGTVKSNLGHAGNAAGVAGIIKTALALKNKMIPPSLHYTKANSEIPFEKGPFYVNTRTKAWESKNNLPLIAGVSSFGIGGTNAHAILEGFSLNGSIEENKKRNNIIAYSAKKPEALKKYFTKLETFIRANNVNLSDLSFSLNTGRANFDYRSYIVFQDKEELLKELDAQKEYGQPSKKQNNIIFVFPGQGSQFLKMGKELYVQEQIFAQYADQGFKILNEKYGTDYARILGYAHDESFDPKIINETQHTQPLLFIIEYALAKMLIEYGITPSLMIGHSLGEYVAACIAGVFSFEEGLFLVAERAFLMSKASTGKMIAVNASFEKIKSIVSDAVSVAAINSDDTTVLSGNEEEIEKCIGLLNEKDIQFTFLKTSHAFHSHMMNDVAAEFEHLFSGITLSKPEIPYVSNLTANIISDSQAQDVRYWKEHMLNTVLFEKGIEYILDNAKEEPLFIEVGSSTLTNSIKNNSRYKGYQIVQLLNKTDENKFYNALGELWMSGTGIDWTKYYQNKNRKKISAPTYAFEENKLDFHVNPFKSFTVDSSSASLDILYEKKWKKSELTKGSKDEKAFCIMFTEDSELSQNIGQELENRNHSVIKIRKKDSLKEDKSIDTEQVKKLLEESKEKAEGNIHIIFNWKTENDNLDSMLSFFRLFNIICKFLISVENTASSSKITMLGDLNSMNITGKNNTILLSSFSQLYICAQENQNIFSTLLDIQSANDTDYDRIADEIEYNFSNPFVAYHEEQRYVPFYERLSLKKEKNLQLESKIIVIIGGSGKIGRILTRYLSDNQARVVVIGRKDVHSLDEAFKTEIGNKVNYYPADISDYESFNSTISHIEKTYGTIHGVVNLVGNPSAESLKLVEHLDINSLKGMFSAKVQGIINLYTVFADRNPDFVWISSSLSAILGGQTFGAYSVSNAYMDYFIAGKPDLNNWISVNLDGFSNNAITEPTLIKIFETTLISELQNHQVIASVKNPNNYLTYDYKINDLPEKSHPEVSIYSSMYAEPVSDTEKALCGIFNNFFEPKKVGVEDNFFELGGDSLKAMTILKRINKEFNVELTPQDLYSSPTIKGLALHMEMISYVSKKEVSKEPNRKTIII